MLKKIISLAILFSFVNLIIGCSTTGYHANRTRGEKSSTAKITAHKFPEVELTTKTQKQYKGKLFSFESVNLTMLPFPYWNEEPVDIHLDEIHSIKVIKNENKAGKGFGWGFGIGFLIPGTFGGLTGKYDEDYQGALAAGVFIGLFVGLLGFIIGGPLISKNKTYLLDISDVPDDELEIKLTPPLNFWMIDYLAVDYTEDMPVTVTEMEAKSALNHQAQNVREVLANNDNKFLVMPNIGDKTELIFDSPPCIENMERSVILKASGYYDIHLNNDGEPQLEVIEKFQTRQGFVIQYAFKEYLKWKKESSQKMSLK